MHVPKFLTRRFDHPLKPAAVYLPLGTLLGALSLSFHPRPIASAVFWVLGGIFSWTLIEYLLHRFVFHWTEGKEPWKTLASGLHMEHHRTANTADLILAPPLGGLIYGICVYAIFALSLSFSAAVLETGFSSASPSMSGCTSWPIDFNPVRDWEGF
jgi:hypothetical protein